MKQKKNEISNFIITLKKRLLHSVAGNPYCRRRLSTVGLLIKIACFVKKKKYVSVIKPGNLGRISAIDLLIKIAGFVKEIWH